MIAFEVWINGEKKCVAGAADLKVLSAILDGNPRHQDSSMSVGGMIGNDHVEWLKSKLKIGDEITIRLIETEVADEPFERHSSETREQRETKVKAHLEEACTLLPISAANQMEIYQRRLAENNLMGAMDALETLGDQNQAGAEFWKKLSYAAHRQSSYEDSGRYSKRWNALKAADSKQQ